MRLLAIDVSTSKDPHNGWSFWDGKDYLSSSFPFQEYADFFCTILELIKKLKPTAVLYAESHGLYNVIRLHARLHGLVDLACDEMGIQSIIINEKHARKVVLGNGKASKEDTMDYFGETSEDIADAKLLIECYNKEYPNE